MYFTGEQCQRKLVSTDNSSKAENWTEFYVVWTLTCFHFYKGKARLCVGCNRLMYHKTVQEFYVSDTAPGIFVVPELVSVQEKHWICKACHNALKQGLLLAQAKVIFQRSYLTWRYVSFPYESPSWRWRLFPVASSVLFMNQPSMSLMIWHRYAPIYQCFHLWFGLLVGTISLYLYTKFDALPINIHGDVNQDIWTLVKIRLIYVRLRISHRYS